MSARSCSLGSTVFFEAQLLFMHEGPHRSIVHLQPTFGELGHEPAQGEVGVRDAFPQPVGMRTLQNAWLMTAHLSRRDAARRPKSLPLVSFPVSFSAGSAAFCTRPPLQSLRQRRWTRNSVPPRAGQPLHPQ